MQEEEEEERTNEEERGNVRWRILEKIVPMYCIWRSMEAHGITAADTKFNFGVIVYFSFD